MIHRLATAGAATLFLPCVLAQTPAYVASIKTNSAVDARTFSEYQSGRFTATAITVAQMLRIAYRIQPYQMAGAPSWISTRRYDIAAKADDGPSTSQQVLLREILQDRFRLAVHSERREQAIFALVVARSDGRLGDSLHKSDFDCAAYMAGPHGAPEPGQIPNCATRIGPGTLSGKAISMAQLAASLAPFADRFTIDTTSLAGVYDVELKWTPDPPPSSLSRGLPDAAPGAPGASLFAALQEQLGLKLVSDRGRVEVLVIDRLEEPSQN